MKRKFTSLISLILTAICAVCLFVSCNKEGTAKAEIVSKNETTVVIKINETEGFATLLDAMTYLKEAGELNFELTGGMVSSIEGKANPADWSACWMLYTSDDELSNTEWGTTEYEGQTYASAAFGAEALQVAVGEYYIWSYQTF